MARDTDTPVADSSTRSVRRSTTSRNCRRDGRGANGRRANRPSRCRAGGRSRRANTASRRSKTHHGVDRRNTDRRHVDRHSVGPPGSDHRGVTRRGRTRGRSRAPGPARAGLAPVQPAMRRPATTPTSSRPDEQLRSSQNSPRRGRSVKTDRRIAAIKLSAYAVRIGEALMWLNRATRGAGLRQSGHRAVFTLSRLFGGPFSAPLSTGPR